MVHFTEDFDCGWCEREDVFRLSSTEFTLIGDNSGSWGYMPKFNVIKKTCSCCGEVSEFLMDWEDTRLGGYYFIYEVDED